MELMLYPPLILVYNPNLTHSMNNVLVFAVFYEFYFRKELLCTQSNKFGSMSIEKEWIPRRALQYEILFDGK